LKKFGQNFLVDKKSLDKVVGAAELEEKDIVLEIGPGLGVLTQEIAKRACKVITIEKDPKMVEILKETLKGFDNIEIIETDARKIEESLIPKGDYKVVGNLPFYITSPITRFFLELPNPPKLLTFMIQKEMAERICAKPGDMSILAVSVQLYAEAEIAGRISKKSFSPQPKVDAAVIKLRIKPNPKINTDLFFKIVKAGFLHQRKQLANNLSVGLNMDKEIIKSWLKKNNIKPEQRAETLSLKEWINLLNSFKID
jgi:16S rRNA (adenine1518-N6/adenine1519-N6)-dimethyltransferase